MMNRKKRIKSILTNYYQKWTIDVIDDSEKHSGHFDFNGNQESHFKLILTTNSNDKVNRLEIHRNINNLLKDEFSSGLHALQINIL